MLDVVEDVDVVDIDERDNGDDGVDAGVINGDDVAFTSIVVVSIESLVLRDKQLFLGMKNFSKLLDSIIDSSWSSDDEDEADDE